MSFLLHESVYFTVFGVKIYMYGVMIALGILAGVALAFWTFKLKGLKSDHIINLALISIPLAILGARIYYCLFYDKPYDFWSFFDISSGGLAVYGAIIGGALGVLLYCVIRKINFFKVADALVPCLAIGQCLGRIGCYFGGCCYGNETDLQLFPFTVEIDGVWHLATFFYESWATLAICIVLMVLLHYINLHGFVFCGYFLLYGIARFFIEGVRGDSLYFLGMRVSQLLSAILIICAIGLIIYLVFYNKKKGNLNDFWLYFKKREKAVVVNNNINNLTVKDSYKENIEKDNSINDQLETTGEKDENNDIDKNINPIKNENSVEDKKELQTDKNEELLEDKNSKKDSKLQDVSKKKKSVKKETKNIKNKSLKTKETKETKETISNKEIEEKNKSKKDNEDKD